MRVLVLTSWFPTMQSPSKAPFVLRDVELLQKDHDVLVVHLANPGTVSPDDPPASGAHIVRVPYHHSRPDTWFEAVRFVRKCARDADLVHTMAFPTLLPAGLAALRRPLVHTEHFSGLVAANLTPTQRTGLSASKNLLRLPDRVVAVGESLKAAMDGHTRAPVAVIPNAVTISAVDRIEREELSRGNRVLMVAVGGIIPGKGPIETLEALAILRQQGIDAHLEWIGEGPLEAEMRKLAADLGVDAHVLLRGAIPPQEVPEALSRANVFVLPTANETFGVALAEALGHGLPVVTTGSGGHLEFLPSAGSRVAPSRTGEQIAAAVMELRDDQDRWRTDRLVAYAQGLFSEELRAEGYREVYAAAVKARELRRRV